jgi:hypothetical protein
LKVDEEVGVTLLQIKERLRLSSSLVRNSKMGSSKKVISISFESEKRL